MFFTDASFLVSAFLNDANGPAAWDWWLSEDTTLTVSRMVLFEAENTLAAVHASANALRPKHN